MKTDAPRAAASSLMDRASLLHSVYRALIKTGRTYAAFEEEQLNGLITQLGHEKEILDPMAGYGTLMAACARAPHPCSAYCLELNPPSYLWQVLIHPLHADTLLSLASKLLANQCRWPQTRLLAECADEWYTEEAWMLLSQLWEMTRGILNKTQLTTDECELRALALLTPFAARLACVVDGELVTQPKKGGICVYKEWQKDLTNYLHAIIARVQAIKIRSRNLHHTIRLADCTSAELPKGRFSAMITSPPYPNGRDYATMFGPENAFLDRLRPQLKNPDLRLLPPRLIGSPRVSAQDGQTKYSPKDVMSPAARRFLDRIAAYKGTTQAIYDNKVYYIPFYSKYFNGIELAYANVAEALAPDFHGFVVVVNNTARKIVIPVAETVMETWRRLGFKANIFDQRELAHVGGINPRVKGMNARHMEYTIEVSRS